MVEDEFLGVEKRPESVLEGGFLVFLAVDCGEQVGSLGWGGFAGKTAYVKFVDNDSVVFAFPNKVFHDVSLVALPKVVRK